MMWKALVGPSEGQSGRQDLDWAYTLVYRSTGYIRTRLNLPLEVVTHQFAFAIVHGDLKTRPEFQYLENFPVFLEFSIEKLQRLKLILWDSLTLAQLKKELKSITKFVPNGFWHFPSRRPCYKGGSSHPNFDPLNYIWYTNLRPLPGHELRSILSSGLILPEYKYQDNVFVQNIFQVLQVVPQ